MKYGLLILIISSLFHSSAFAEQPVYISIGSDVIDFAQKKFGPRFDVQKIDSDVSIVSVDQAAIPWLSLLIHQEYGRCGGFMWHEDEQEAFMALEQNKNAQAWQKTIFADYSIDRSTIVRPLMSEVQPQNIVSMIEGLSAFHNRYYTSETGVASAHFIADRWREMTNFRNDIEVRLFEHQAWAQPSVILTIRGQTDETIIVGGHADSIAGFFRPAGSRAPGADDNASGISTITEVARIIAESGYRPYRTLQFMAYAAEEVGLRGSQEIAEHYKAQGVPVVGVLQLDMTNFAGSAEDIVLMNDFTNQAQNAFLGELIDHYLPELSWGYDRCGYGCSDHASWTKAGFPASIPFESKMRQKNPHIHTERDTLSRMSTDGSHAAKFAKLALAFVLELDEDILP